LNVEFVAAGMVFRAPVFGVLAASLVQKSVLGSRSVEEHSLLGGKFLRPETN
jgi:hypothetical protein